MNINKELLEKSRECVICNRVVSSIYSGQPVEDALLSGLLAASEVIKVHHDQMINFMNNYPAPFFIANKDQ